MKNLDKKGVEMDSEKETERSHCFSVWKREGIKKDSMVGKTMRRKCRDRREWERRIKETQGKQIRQVLDLILSH